MIARNIIVRLGSSGKKFSSSSTPRRELKTFQSNNLNEIFSKIQPFSTITITSPPTPLSPHNQNRTYISRAHAEPRPTFPIIHAVPQTLSEISDRRTKRALLFEANRSSILARRRSRPGWARNDYGPEDEYCHMDETVELILNLNVDPKKPGQALRGSAVLPHGTGKKTRMLIFVSDDEDIVQDLEGQYGDDDVSGGGGKMIRAGGSAWIEQIKSGGVPLDVTKVDRVLATSDMARELGSSGLARILGPRGLMPSEKTGTVVQVGSLDGISSVESEMYGRLKRLVREEIHGKCSYRTDSEGIIHVPIGKGSFTEDMILDNIKAFINVMEDVKPETYGKGKKKGTTKKGTKKGTTKKSGKFYLKAYLSSTQGRSIKIDLRTLEPSSPFFMSEVR